MPNDEQISERLAKGELEVSRSAEPSEDLAIDIEGLTKTYGDHKALDGVTSKVKKGEIFGFLGPNGAGKTTTIKVLTTITPPTHGEAKVLGYDVTRQGAAIRQRIGLVQQQPSYEPFMTVEQNLRTYGLLWNMKKDEIDRRMTSLLELFGLKDVLRVKPPELSIGQRKRLQVAREFMHDMDLLFLDEPTTGLDPQVRRALLNHLKERAKNGLTIFFTTHIMQEAEFLCDRIAVIHKGRILACDSAANLRDKFGGGTLIEIFAKDADAATWDAISEVPGVRQVVPPREADEPLRVSVDTPSTTLPSLLEALARRGCSVTGVNVKEASLEEAFLRMVAE
jgi:ABC-2 type transport system ATP-binding protein